MPGTGSAPAQPSGAQAPGDSAAASARSGFAAPDQAVSGGSGRGSVVGRFLLSPAITVGSSVAMGTTMVFMLLLVI